VYSRVACSEAATWEAIAGVLGMARRSLSGLLLAEEHFDSISDRVGGEVGSPIFFGQAARRRPPVHHPVVGDRRANGDLSPIIGAAFGLRTARLLRVLRTYCRGTQGNGPAAQAVVDTALRRGTSR
jgi:hypothetical protein